MPSAEDLAPIDSYLLSPTRFQEDAFRVPAHFPLQQIQFPLQALARLIRQDGDFNAPAEAVRHFQRKTSWPFDGLAPSTTSEPVLPSGEPALSYVRLGCTGSAMVGWFALGSVPSVSNHKGAAKTWSATCDTCDQLLTPNTLRGRQFLDDMQIGLPTSDPIAMDIGCAEASCRNETLLSITRTLMPRFFMALCQQTYYG